MADGSSGKVRVAIFGSLRGSNARALIEYSRKPECSYAVVLVVSNRPDAGILEVAASYGIPSRVLVPRSFASDAEYVHALLGVLEEFAVECIALAGYLVKVPAEVVERYRDRILNIHPALLPKYGGKGMYGIHVHRAVLAAGEEYTGVTIHRVTEEYDAGPIVEQVRVPIFADDTPESLMARVQETERAIYPVVLDEYCRLLRASG